MYSYPYDPTGKAASNRFHEEHIVTSDEKNLRVIRLEHAPFFRPLTITYGNSDSPLTEGVDFEYAYELVELDDCVAGPVFMGVNLINPLILGSVRFEGNHLGGTFYAPYFEMMDDLIKHLNNPISASWLSLLGRPALMPPMPSATSWDDLLNKKYLASAIRELKVGAEAGHAIIKTKLDDLKNVVNGIYNDIVTFNYPGHQAEWNPHDTTVVQIGAHPASAKVPDAMLAYGKRLKALTEEIRALGLQQSEIDKYIAYNCCDDVSGTFVQMVAANRPLFRSPAGETELIFTDTSYELRSNGSVVLAVGVDLANHAESYIEWIVGPNKLRVTSSADKLGMASLTLNGAALLNGVTIQDYQAQGGGGTDPDDNELQISGVRIDFTGKGSLLDPVQGNLVIPKATLAADGAAKLQSAAGTETAGVAAATDATAPYQQQQANFVIKETRINDKPMTGGSLTIGKDALGLGSADNTSDLNKPLSKALRDWLDRLAAKNHKHDWTGLSIPAATTSVYGITKYASTNGGLAALKAVAPAVLVDLATRAETLRLALQNTNPSAVVDFAAVDTAVWRVNASKTSVSVQDMRYFYVLTGERKEGRATGTINFDTTPMFNWMLPTNNNEKRWGAAVLHNTQLVKDLGVLPTCARTVGRSAAEMGALAYTSMLFKERVMVPRGQVRIRCQAGGKITVYLNGTERGSAVDFFDQTYDVEELDSEQVVAIRVDPDSPTKPAAAWFDILDKDFTMAYSQPGTAISTLEEFYSPYGMRHYLYLNLRSGSLFSRAEMPVTLGIDLTKLLLGYVDVPQAGLVSGATFTLPAVVDYGEFRELEEHSSKTLVHKPKLSDFSIADAAEVRTVPIVDADPQWSVVRLAGAVSESWGYVDVTATGTTDVPSRMQVGFSTETAHPAHWVVPQNPQEGNVATIDGVMMVNAPTTVTGDEYGDDLWFFVSQRGNNPLAPMIRINPYSGVLEHSFTQPKFVGERPSYGDVLLGAFPTNNIVATMKQTSGWDEDLPLSAFGFENGETQGLDWQLPRRIIMRYRYIPSTHTLRLCFDIYRNGVAKRWWREYVLSIDIAHLFKQGVVGLERKAVTAVCKWRAFPSWQPMLGGSAQALEDKFEYLPALMDGYCEFDNLTVSEPVSITSAPESPQNHVSAWYWGGEYSEFMAMPVKGGHGVAHNHAVLWPAPAYHRPPHIFAPKLLRGQLWDYAAPDYKGGRHSEGFYIIVDVPSFGMETTVTPVVKTTAPMYMVLGATDIIAIPLPEGSAGGDFSDIPRKIAADDCVKRNRLVIYVHIPKGRPVENLLLNVKLIFDNAGVVTEWVMSGDQDVYISEYAYCVRQKNPWHLTQRVLGMLRARVKAQKG